MTRPIRLLACVAVLIATSAGAYDPIVIARGWQQVNAVQDGDCSGEVRSNGQFYVLTVTGLAPGEDARLVLTNGDMKPIDRTVRAKSDGTWQEYYIPYRENHPNGGLVEATITALGCQVPLRFEWRPRPGWDEPGPL